ncbi:MAG: cation:proton antiporter, partial [Burkholderiales bacterium]|nr:cation:proton antiporter [Burkholderiales bacterium]
MNAVVTGLLLLAALAVLAVLARRVPVPLPLLLIAGGIGLAFVPGFGAVSIDPDMFFVLFIPPLLYADGWFTPRREFVAVLRPVLLLAFGLVLMTVVAVGLLLHAMVPTLPLAAAFALGAIVSPTDAVATSAMVGRVGMPARAVHVLNGESLINDASGLVAFKFAVAALATGAFSLGQAAIELVLLAGGGTLIGLAVAW